MVQIMVSEVACTDEGCVPLETLVIVVSRDARWLGKLLVPVAEVTQEMCEGDDLKLPTNWWLYSMLFLLRQREPELSLSDVESAYDWLVAHCNDSLLGALEAVSQQRQTAAEDKARAERALLLLSKCLGLGTGSGSGLSLSAGEGSPGVKEDVELPGKAQAEAEANAAAVATATPRPPVIPIAKYVPPPTVGASGTLPAPRHNKNAGIRQRGCPCCDPDNIDNIVDSLFMSNI